jgi:hypothetical protein
VYEETTNGFSISRKHFDNYIADEETPNFTQTKFSATNRYISTVQVTFGVEDKKENNSHFHLDFKKTIDFSGPVRADLQC